MEDKKVQQDITKKIDIASLEIAIDVIKKYEVQDEVNATDAISCFKCLRTVIDFINDRN